MQQRIISCEMSLTSQKHIYASKISTRHWSKLEGYRIDLKGTRADWASSRTSERKLQEKLKEAEEGSREYANRIARLVSRIESSKEKIGAQSWNWRLLIRLKETKLRVPACQSKKINWSCKTNGYGWSWLLLETLGDLKGNVEESNQARKHLVSTLIENQTFKNSSSIGYDEMLKMKPSKASRISQISPKITDKWPGKCRRYSTQTLEKVLNIKGYPYKLTWNHE